MQVFVFFNSLDSAKNLVKTYSASAKHDVELCLFSMQLLEQDEYDDLLQLGYSIANCLNMEAAMKEASEKVKIGAELIINLDSVVPVSDWQKRIYNAKSRHPSIQSCFGRWYREPLVGREFVSNDSLGFKYKDIVPGFIANSVYDFCVDPKHHSIKVSRIPIFFNWFSEEMTPVVKAGMANAKSMIELSHFITDYGALDSRLNEFYYLPEIEVLDKRLLK